MSFQLSSKFSKARGLLDIVRCSSSLPSIWEPPWRFVPNNCLVRSNFIQSISIEYFQNDFVAEEGKDSLRTDSSSTNEP